MRARGDMDAAQKSFYLVLDGKYHPAIKLAVAHRFLPCLGPERRKMLRKLPELIGQVAADAQVPQDELYNLMSRLASALWQLASLKDFDPAAREFMRLRPDRPDAMLFNGFYQYLAAYEARGRGDQVPPDRQKAFQDGLVHAEATLQKCWEMDPDRRARRHADDQRQARAGSEPRRPRGDGAMVQARLRRQP
jgi:hypothetical protein